MRHLSSLLTTAAVLAAAVVVRLSLPSNAPVFGVDAQGAPTDQPSEGFECAIGERFKPQLAALVAQIEVCVLDGQVFSVRLTPRPGMGGNVERFHRPGFGEKYGWSNDFRFEKTREGDLVFHRPSAAAVLIGNILPPPPARPAARPACGHTEGFHRARAQDSVLDLSELNLRSVELGVEIGGVVRGSGPYAIGLRNGDVITHVAGEDVSSASALSRRYRHRTRRTSTLNLLRDGIAMELTSRI